jgi:hypothetical protein
MCCVKIQNDCSESFETRQGLRQGDVLSTLLFNVVPEVIVRRVNLQTTGTIYNKETQLLAYADDIDIVSRSQSAVRVAYVTLEKDATKVGLTINEQKTKYMIAAGNDRTIRDVGKSVAIGDNHFEVVKEFVYLGTLMTPTDDVSLEIQRRIQTANKCFFGLRKHLQSSHLSRQTKFTIHKTLIRPVLLYGSERRTNCSYLRGRCSERYAARKSKMVSTGEGTTTNSREFDSPNVLNVTKTNRLRYAGHMIRRPEDLPQKALFRATPNERKNQGRPKSRWADGVNIDSLALEVRDWTYCAQDNADMERSSSTGLNQVLVVVPHKQTSNFV